MNIYVSKNTGSWTGTYQQKPGKRTTQG